MRARALALSLGTALLGCQTTPPPLPPPPVRMIDFAGTEPVVDVPLDPYAPQRELEIGKLERISLRVDLIKQGFLVRVDAGIVAPGCKRVGAGVSVPKIGARYDFVGLQSCARKIRDANPKLAAEQKVIISADAGTTFQQVIATMDALRGDARGPLFPSVAFAVR